MNKLDDKYWSERYLNDSDPWTLNRANPGLVEFFVNQHIEKDKCILIPGIGHSKEVFELIKLGYSNIHVSDISAIPLEKFRNVLPDEHIHQGDFFELKGTFDIIMEQTFFCAISPHLWTQLRDKLAELLKPGGIYFGVFFERESMPSTLSEIPGPPFFPTKVYYEDLFSERFIIKELSPNKSGIKARSNNELFFIFENK